MFGVTFSHISVNFGETFLCQLALDDSHVEPHSLRCPLIVVYESRGLSDSVALSWDTENEVVLVTPVASLNRNSTEGSEL